MDLLTEMLSACKASEEGQGKKSAVGNFSDTALADEVCSLIMEEQQSNSHMGENTHLILKVAYGVMITAGLVLNLAVILVVARRSQFQTPRNLFIVNLTVSDIILCLVCMPFTLTMLLYKKWTLGETLCKLVPALQGANIMVSTGTIAAIALDRYFTIVRCSPYNAASGRRSDNREKQRVVYSIFIVWLLSVLAVLPLLFYQKVEVVELGGLILYQTCMESWPSPAAKHAYTVVTLTVMYVIPILVVSVVHVKIVAFLTTHTNRAHVLAEAAASGSSSANISAQQGRALREIARNKKTTTLLLVVAALFALSWLPHYVFSVVAELYVISPENLYITTAVCHLLAMSTAITNPIVYGLLNSNIRKGLFAMFPRCLLKCCCKNKSSNRRGLEAAAENRGTSDAQKMSGCRNQFGENTSNFGENILLERRHGGNEKTSTTLVHVPPSAANSTPRRETISTHLVSEL